MVQSDFCLTCQRVIKTHLGLIVERRLQKVLVQRGFSADAVKVIKGSYDPQSDLLARFSG
jgi:hypothetical protein